jgi:hypothetical protein
MGSNSGMSIKFCWKIAFSFNSKLKCHFVGFVYFSRKIEHSVSPIQIQNILVYHNAKNITYYIYKLLHHLVKQEWKYYSIEKRSVFSANACSTS